MSDVAVVLRKARNLYAANPSHVLDGPLEAGTYCIVTAIATVSPRCSGLSVMYDVTGAGSLADWNAENSTETVLAAFDKAITEADNA